MKLMCQSPPLPRRGRRPVLIWYSPMGFPLRLLGSPREHGRTGSRGGRSHPGVSSQVVRSGAGLTHARDRVFISCCLADVRVTGTMTENDYLCNTPGTGSLHTCNERRVPLSPG